MIKLINTSGTTVGADPEFFVSINGEMVSAHGMVEGTKYKPHPVECGAVQVDGMALEFNIDPSNNKNEFTTNISTVLEGLRALIPEQYAFEFKPVAMFGEDYIREQPEEAKELGCEPDYNAYTGGVNPTPDPNGSFRTAAGHIHIGVPQELDITEKRKLVILCDLVLGLYSLTYDGDAMRRELYGKAGCYRDKPYGIEYRTLSNAWLTSNRLQEEIYNRTIIAVELLPHFNSFFEFLKDKLGLHYTCLEEVINNSNLLAAEHITEVLEEYIDVRFS